MDSKYFVHWSTMFLSVQRQIMNHLFVLQAKKHKYINVYFEFLQI